MKTVYKSLIQKTDILALAFKIAIGNRLLANHITDLVMKQQSCNHGLTWIEVQVMVMSYYNHLLKKEYAHQKLFLKHSMLPETPDLDVQIFNKEQFEKLRPRKEKWADFAQAKAYLKTVGLQSFNQWRKYIKSGDLPKNIPRSPEMFYREQWTGWRDFLGIRPYLSYAECKEWVKKNLVYRCVFTYTYWLKIMKHLPPFIPANPNSAYNNKGWKSWSDFLEPPAQNELMLTYEEAKLFSHNYLLPVGINSAQKYHRIRDENLTFLPLDLKRYYAKKGWSVFDFFKTARRRRSGKKNYLSFEEARIYFHQHLVPKGINSVKKWNDLVDGNIEGLIMPANIPLQPWGYYQKAGWQGNNYWFDPQYVRP